MHLTSLEMQGFKSFPERTVIEFHEGITAIVGPNGSGKSNVADAIRWVLGEQSVRSLRGDKMEDVVFNGTENRRAMGFAEVAINFDNSDQVLPLEYNHVRIVRRYYRSGESEYMINQTPCRLKDITALFMDTGIGRDGYSLVSQGKVDEILSTRSEDRRRIFDEASGIVKYKSRQLEAERKLARTDTNLIRINDILTELSDRISPLRSQSEKARIYLELASEMKKLDIALILHQLGGREEEANKLNETRAQLSNDLTTTEANIARGRKGYELVGQKIRDLEARTESLRVKHSGLLDQLSEKNNSIVLLKEQNRNFDKDKVEAKAEIERLARQQELLLAERETREHKRNVLLKQRSAFTEQLSEVTARYQAILNKMSDQAQAQENLRQQLAEMRERIFAVDTAQARFESESQLLKRQYENISQQLSQMEADLQEILQAQLEVRNQISAAETDVNSLVEKKDLNDKLLSEWERKVSDLETKKQKYIQKIRDYDYQREVLKKLEENLEGYLVPVKKIMQKLQAEPDFAPDVKGPLGSLIEVEEKYEVAIEVALGTSSNHIVTTTEESAKNLVEWLKESQSGRATFLPIETIKPKELSSNIVAFAKKSPGYLGIAAELISYPEEIENIVRYQLGRTLVCDDLSKALALAASLKYGCRIVTLEGDLVNPGGSITGGSLNFSASGIIGRSGRIAKLGKIREGLRAKNEELLTDLAAAHEELDHVTEIDEGVLTDIRSLREEISNYHVHLDALVANEEKLKEKLARERDIAEQLQVESATLEAKFLASQQDKTKDEKLLLSLSAQIDKESSQRDSDRAERDRLRERETDLKVSLGSIEQSLDGITDFVRHLEEQAVSGRSRQAQLEKVIADSARGQSDNLGQLKQLDEDLEQLRHDISELALEVEEQNRKKDQLEGERLRLYQNLESQAESLAAIRGELGKLEEALLRIEHNNDQLRNRLWEDYELTVATAGEWRQEISNYNKSQRELNRLKAKIKDLGAVNLDAIKEFEAVQDRFSFMDGQREDIELSRQELTSLISELDQAMEEQFKIYFKEISLNFDTVFRELFGGGFAELSLADTDDLLNTDIIIKAQPPGKRLQNLSLLSGGERSLTAIALLFAIFRLKPAPFCVFDEVESTLDDANVIRFNNYIKRYSSGTQFILVTHRKGTMESAERLYGVTMQERGVSSIYSMKLSDYPAD